MGRAMRNFTLALLAAALLVCGCELIIELPDIPCADSGVDSGPCIGIYLDMEEEEL